MKKGNRQDFGVKEIAKGVFWIDEFKGSNCYLVVGDERALLIDCGTGFADLRGFAEKLTDKPITLAASHIHPDHSGGKRQFEQITAHKNDCNWFGKASTAYAVRISCFIAFIETRKNYGIKFSDVRRGGLKTKFVPFEDGHIFDLGGRKVRTEHVGGHTSGSVLMFLDDEKIMFVGDNSFPRLWLHLPYAYPVEDWIPIGKHIYDLSAEYAIYGAHFQMPQAREEIAALIKTAEDLVEKKKHRNHLFPIAWKYPKMKAKIGICYRGMNIKSKNKNPTNK